MQASREPYCRTSDTPITIIAQFHVPAHVLANGSLACVTLRVVHPGSLDPDSHKQSVSLSIAYNYIIWQLHELVIGKDVQNGNGTMEAMLSGSPWISRQNPVCGGTDGFCTASSERLGYPLTSIPHIIPTCRSQMNKRYTEEGLSPQSRSAAFTASSKPDDVFCCPVCQTPQAFRE